MMKISNEIEIVLTDREIDAALRRLAREKFRALYGLKNTTDFNGLSVKIHEDIMSGHRWATIMFKRWKT